MNEKNCKELAKQSDIDGFLVGGASLKPACRYSLLSSLEEFADFPGSCGYHQRESISISQGGDESRQYRF